MDVAGTRHGARTPFHAISCVVRMEAIPADIPTRGAQSPLATPHTANTACSAMHIIIVVVVVMLQAIMLVCAVSCAMRNDMCVAHPPFQHSRIAHIIQLINLYVLDH